jgi:hypothetical protein
MIYKSMLEFNEEKYTKAIGLSEPSEDQLNSMVDRVRLLLSYRAEMAKKILEQHKKQNKDFDLIALLEHMYQHYNDLIKDSLNLD